MASSEGTPPASDASKREKNPFTEKELGLLQIAMMHCLKTGPPEIDYNKFMEHGQFNTMKTAHNTWGKIKSKLKAAGGPKESEDGEGGDEIGTPKGPKTPKKPTPKKRGKVEDQDDDEDDDKNVEATPKKKRKSPAKKTPRKLPKAESEADDEVGGHSGLQSETVKVEGGDE